MVVVLGIDVHKNTHTAGAVDEVGRELDHRTVRATDAGHRQLLRWVLRRWPDAELRFAVEDCRHVSTRLERALLAAGQSVVRVPPKLMATARQSVRMRGKSDPIDALAIARAALREPDLPIATHDGVSREIKLLVDHREDLVNTRTQMQNRLRWHLHELDPELDPAARSLDRLCELDRLDAWLAQQPPSIVVRIATELVTDIRTLTVRANALEHELAALMERVAPRLLALPGCGALTAAKIVGETANVTRFRSEACFAMHAGAAPIPASSGKTIRHRLARGGNRQLNAALHRIAVTQIRLHGPGHDYFQRRRTRGDTTMEALRALKRHLARIVYNALQQSTTHQSPRLTAAA
ncbi:transposase [Prauserella shujinwangii]|uniref:Transposase n=1 Tax=Prauserella shujinwangii TaxID=1453103 RepID=A0A2T0LK18_9PSEU|nr:IS110 family transposase [Prauserella shujinwangii]PRX43060.1 transposase [Prauserella shujinwangii]